MESPLKPRCEEMSSPEVPLSLSYKYRLSRSLAKRALSDKVRWQIKELGSGKRIAELLTDGTEDAVRDDNDKASPMVSRILITKKHQTAQVIREPSCQREPLFKSINRRHLQSEKTYKELFEFVCQRESSHRL